MTKKKKDKPPSRKKYEREHPVMSIRMDRELHGKMKAIKEDSSYSIIDMLRVAVGKIEVKLREENEIYEEAHAAGVYSGFNSAKEMYGITYKCAGCGQKITVSDIGTKQAIVNFLRERRAGHVECLKKRGWI